MVIGRLWLPVLAFVVCFPAFGPAQTAVAPAAPALTREQVEKFLLEARLMSVRPVGRGVTNTQRGTLSDGQLTHDASIQDVDESRAIFETPKGIELNFRDSYRYNIAAYRLSLLLDLDNVPITVERSFEGRPASYVWWLDDVMFEEGERLKRKTTGPDPNRYASFVHIQRVFDELIQNSDRNLGNTLWTKDWKMWLIDHTRAFRLGKDLRNPKLLERVDRTMLQRMRELTEPKLKEAVGESLTSLELEAVVARAGVLVAFFDKRIAQLGESGVLYTRRP